MFKIDRKREWEGDMDGGREEREGEGERYGWWERERDF